MPFTSPALWRGVVDECIDGDTYVVAVDCGFGQALHVRVRLVGADTWEIVGEHKVKGLAAKAWVESHLVGRPVRMTTWKKEQRDEYRQSAERYIAQIEILWYGTWMDFALILNQTEHVRS